MRWSQWWKHATLNHMYIKQQTITFLKETERYKCFKKTGPNSITYLKCTPTFEWCMVWCGSKNEHQQDICLTNIEWPHVQNFINNSKLNNEHNWEAYVTKWWHPGCHLWGNLINVRWALNFPAIEVRSLHPHSHSPIFLPSLDRCVGLIFSLIRAT